jgi:hypothetical protein
MIVICPAGAARRPTGLLPGAFSAPARPLGERVYAREGIIIDLDPRSAEVLDGP